ncbi:viral transactivating protein [Human immunodeficiency virus 2]|uniref:Protein Rev n=1 Tax=Human immunodeficiency virus type 2 subtype A (isolate KR) TaxID=73484 RepID=REV_HV2KR|nr:RecName: Full=Protein Rev; AltName: Full=Regulator of expression of viral proteins [Human immunodeficiency virus type 2 (isolate KR)]AAA64581.1 viral transactivating protein [Human immunodeficiency virus 2]
MNGRADEEGLQRKQRLIRLLHQTNPYPQGLGTARQRRNRRRRRKQHWRQLVALANSIYTFPDPPADSPLDRAIQRLQGLTIQELPDPPTNLPESSESTNNNQGLAETYNSLPAIWVRVDPRSAPGPCKDYERDSCERVERLVGGNGTDRQGNTCSSKKDQAGGRTCPPVRGSGINRETL